MEASGLAASGAVGRQRPRLQAAKPRYGEKAIKVLLAGCALLSVATTTAIVFSLLIPAVDFFREVPFGDFFLKSEWAPAQDLFGVIPLVVGTFNVVLWGMLVAIPVGLGAAIYLSEYASPRTRKLLKPALEVLAGIPTVVYGFFALFALGPLVRGLWWGDRQPSFQNLLIAGVAMGVMIVPTVASLAEDAMTAVPRALRYGAYALASTRMQVATRVVFPAAFSGIVAAVVLGISRAIGETMIVTVAGGLISDHVNADPSRGSATMTAFIASAGQGDLPLGSIGYRSIFAVGALLFVLTFALNILSIRLVRRYREAYE
jgi:phosphate transport system permease protein